MTEKQMFDLLVTEGLSEHGAAALLGHFQAESGLNPRNLQNIYEKKLGFTDDTYTVAVDSGSYVLGTGWHSGRTGRENRSSWSLHGIPDALSAMPVCSLNLRFMS